MQLLRAMDQGRHDEVAAPPDDGGGRGSYTMPQDTLTLRDQPQDEYRDRHPELHRDPAHNRKMSPEGATPLLWGAGMLVLLMVVGFMLFAWAF